MTRVPCNPSWDAILQEVHSIYGPGPVVLHRPVFEGPEREYLVQCIDSNFVSSVGERVGEFEQRIAQFTGAAHAVATVNGTAALQMALLLAGVQPGDEVISQPLTFVATCNALASTGAHPVFVDVDQDTLGMSPGALRAFLQAHVELRHGVPVNRSSGRRIRACVPMHTFGLPARIRELVALCNEWSIPVIEDAAESLGSLDGAQHTGTFGLIGTLSFNGNKLLTTGGGGMLILSDPDLARRGKHLTTTAKVPHAWEFVHDEIGYNHRMPNLNAALGCAQMDRVEEFLAAKAAVAARYAAFFSEMGIPFLQPRAGCRSNHWLNAILLANRAERDGFLEYTNARGVMTRPVWRLMTELVMFRHCQHDGLEVARWLQDRVVNLPSSVPDGVLPPWRETRQGALQP